MRRRGRDGFSLVEVLVAMAVLGVGILGLGLLQLSALRMRQGVQQRLVAQRLADHLAEAAAQEGRDSLQARQQGRSAPIHFLGGGPLVQQWPLEGWLREPGARSVLPAFFRTRVAGRDVVAAGRGPALHRLEVRVEWLEEVGAPLPVPRTHVLIREVAHAGAR